MRLKCVFQSLNAQQSKLSRSGRRRGVLEDTPTHPDTKKEEGSEDALSLRHGTKQSALGTSTPEFFKTAFLFCFVLFNKSARKAQAHTIEICSSKKSALPRRQVPCPRAPFRSDSRRVDCTVVSISSPNFFFSSHDESLVRRCQQTPHPLLHAGLLTRASNKRRTSPLLPVESSAISAPSPHLAHATILP